jgi:Tol biopolymer transport system component
MAWIRTDGSGQEEKLSTKDTVQRPSSFTPDGQRLLFYESTPGGGIEVWMLPLVKEGAAIRPGQAEPFLPGGLTGQAPALSPDGKWLAYVEPGSANLEVYVRPLAASASVPGSRWQVSNRAHGRNQRARYALLPPRPLRRKRPPRPARNSRSRGA